MTKRFLLIDANNLMYASQYSATKLHAGDVEVTAVFGVLGMLRNALLRFPGATPIMLWDSSPSWRADIYPEYKGNRKSNAQVMAITMALRPQRPILKDALRDLGVRQYTVYKHEADDLAADLSRKLSDKGAEVILMTRDGDWQQLVNDKVVWYDYKKEFILTPQNFEEHTGFKTPQHFVQGKIIMGDAGDNVKGLGGLGEGAAKIIMQDFESFDDLVNRWPDFEADIEKGSNWSRYYKSPVNRALADPEIWTKHDLNVQLMDLVNRQYPGIQYQTDSKYNEAVVKDNFGRLGFHSILRKYDPWIEPFLK